jgi:hypothetical protein
MLSFRITGELGSEFGKSFLHGVGPLCGRIPSIHQDGEKGSRGKGVRTISLSGKHNAEPRGGLEIVPDTISSDTIS